MSQLDDVLSTEEVKRLALVHAMPGPTGHGSIPIYENPDDILSLFRDFHMLVDSHEALLALLASRDEVCSCDEWDAAAEKLGDCLVALISCGDIRHCMFCGKRARTA